MINVIEEILQLFERRGGSLYGGEAVTQLEHALQAAWLAESEQAGPELIVAALLHDVGHLLHHLPDDAPDAGTDDHHENSAANYLQKRFSNDVVEPVRLHVAAKRYLCAVDESYHDALSRPSMVSLALQGGPMTQEEAAAFESQPHFRDALRLRRWDDEAKVVQLRTPPLAHFAQYMTQVVCGAAAKELPA